MRTMDCPGSDEGQNKDNEKIEEGVERMCVGVKTIRPKKKRSSDEWTKRKRPEGRVEGQ